MLNDDRLSICLEMAKVSKATYAGPINHQLYRYDGIPFKGQKIIHGSFGRGYCRIFWHDHSVVIGFRGTRESVDWTVSNFKAFPVALRDCENSKKVLVHRGFQNTLDFGDKTTQLRSLDAILEYLEGFDLLDRKISITGHSMGAALALLFAVKLRARHPEAVHAQLDSIITFAGPAVGLGGFKRFYGDLAEKTIRFVNGSDVVPFAPPAFFHHVGEELWLSDGLTKRDVGWQKRLLFAAKSRFVSSIKDHAISEYIKKLEMEVAKRKQYQLQRDVGRHK